MSNITVATEILKQLGGRQFMVMTGVKNLVADETAISMHLPKNNSKAKYLRIEITNADTYNMIFRTINKKDFTFPLVAEFEGVYAEKLQSIFTEVTGLFTKL